MADLRARRLELTRSAIESTLVEGDLDRFRVVLDTLAGEHDIVEIALAAVKLAHEASGQLDEDEARSPRSARPARGPRPPTPRPRTATWPGSSSARAAPRASPRATWWARSRASPASTAGRSASIEISDRFSIVEVPDESAQEVIAGPALQHHQGQEGDGPA